MQVFNAFMKISLKRLPEIVIYFIIFMVINLILANALSGESSYDFEARQYNIAVIDHDDTTISNALYDYLGKLHILVDIPANKEDILDSLYYRQVSYVLTIPEGFAEDLEDTSSPSALENNRNPGSLSGLYIDGQIESFFTLYHLFLAGGYTQEEAISLTTTQLLAQVSVDAQVEDLPEQDTNITIHYYFQYIPYVLVLIILLGLSPILTTFRKTDIHARIACSSTPASQISFQLILGCGVYSFSIWFLFILIALIQYPGFMITTKGLMLVLNSFAFLLITTALATFISSLGIGKNAVTMIANVVGLGMSFLCGVFVPMWLLSDTLLKFSRFLPAYWYIRINNMVSGFSGEELLNSSYWNYLLIQVFFAIAFFALTLMNNRMKSSKHQ